MFDKMDLGDMIKKAQEMQEKMQEAQKEAEKIEVTGLAGADLVQTKINGKYEVLAVKIDDTLLDDKKLLEDLLAASFSDAISKLKKQTVASQGNLFGSLPAGMKLPF